MCRQSHHPFIQEKPSGSRPIKTQTPNPIYIKCQSIQPSRKLCTFKQTHREKKEYSTEYSESTAV